MDPATLLVLAIAILLVVGYFGGGLVNRRRAERWVRSLRDAFPEATDARVAWPARNVFRLELEQALPGIRQLVIQGLLAPREAPLVWVVWAARRQGDLLDLQADLGSVPSENLVFDPRHRLGRAAGEAASAEGMELGRVGSAGLWIASRDAAGRSRAERLIPLAAQGGDPVVVRTRAAQPRLDVVLLPHGAPDDAAARIAPMLRQLAAEAIG